MSESHDPQEAISKWQEWYRNNRTVAEMDEPLVSKDSRENLHDTSKATDTLPDWRQFYEELLKDPHAGVFAEPSFKNKYKEKAIEHFADTIAEFVNEMTGVEMYECFVEAVKENLAYVTVEYDRAKDLYDLATGKTNVKKR